MDARTIAALDRLNRSFYEARADEFSATRYRPWAGWHRLSALLAPLGAEPRARILDLGSGNGRFRAWLEQEAGWPRGGYMGLERSPALIAEAARRLGRQGWARADPVAAGGRLPVRPHAFEAAVAMGLLHHVPSFELRRRIVSEMADCLAPGGLLVLTHWQFADKPRFSRRRIPWQDHERVLGAAIDLRQLETGDHLLAWGDAVPDARAARYCHHTSPEEAERLVAGLALGIAETFLADGSGGDGNLYVVLRRPASPLRDLSSA